MFNLSYLTIFAIVTALVLTLVLAAFLTPARWWRQLNARALAIVVLGTWGFASLFLWAMPQPAPHLQAQLTTPATAGVAPVALPQRERAYRVYDALNLRAARGTEAPRLAVVPAGSVVTTTGVRDGDWWQVRARVAGAEVQGWSNSLWLRRADEKPM